MSNAPRFKALDALVEFYKELSAPERFTYRTMVAIYPAFRKAEPYYEVVSHTEPHHIKLTKDGYRNVRRVDKVCYTDKNGKQVLNQKVERTIGSLYTPQRAYRIGPGKINYEWALLMKIDADIARRKTGYIEDGLIHYVDDLNPVISEKIEKARARLAKKSASGRPPKSNTQDLTERYGRNDPKVQEWIDKYSAELDGADFKHDGFQDSVMLHSVELKELDINLYGKDKE